jgi:dTDP-4-dehydrorhamnose reductase
VLGCEKIAQVFGLRLPEWREPLAMMLD